MNIFKHKTVLITGASSGIGKTFAYKLNELGANLILSARSKDKLDSMALEMNNAIVISGDLSDPLFPNILYSKVKQKKVHVDILINNAGFGSSGLFLDSSIKNYEEMLNVNIISLTKLTHLFLEDMVKNKTGGIINISSLASFQAMPYFSVYSSSKAYVTSFTLGLYEEYRDQGIRVLGVCPGYTKTNFNKRADLPPENSSKGYIMTSEAVVEESLRAYKNGKYIIINGIINKLTRFFMNLIPQSLALRLLKYVIKKGMNGKKW